MANIAIFRINYKSDFILTLNSDAGWMTPFCIKFWTGALSQAYFVGFDGTTYTHCAPVDGEPTKLLVQFDDHNLPIGDLKFQIGYHFTVADFPTSVEDEVVNQASVIIEVDDVPAQVMLDLNGETAPEIEFSLPAYANEAQRIANEEQRIANEEQRIANEEARIAAETIRQQNEAQRISNEESRVTEFARLKQESETATADANAAAALANEKAALADDKAALADAAATLANEKAQLAADKAALAQAAATLANEKAALAQQKAAYAQTQGDYAKAQGDYAKEQGEIAEEDHERAEADHTRAESDHTQATSDHTQAGTDHSTAVNDHTQSVTDHTQADTDHTRAESDHTQAASDHTQAGADHTRAESDHTTASADHTQAGQDHTRAESDHTRAESDHAAVEVYVDSLGAFDISAYHATGGVLAKYADLAAALGTNGANIPDALRKGGMSVKFVQSSDNKYVQYFLTKDEWSASESDWEKINLEKEINKKDCGLAIVSLTSNPTKYIPIPSLTINGKYYLIFTLSASQTFEISILEKRVPVTVSQIIASSKTYSAGTYIIPFVYTDADGVYLQVGDSNNWPFITSVFLYEDTQESLIELQKRIEPIPYKLEDVIAKVGNHSESNTITEFNDVFWDGSKFVAPSETYRSHAIPLFKGGSYSWSINTGTIFSIALFGVKPVEGVTASRLRDLSSASSYTCENDGYWLLVAFKFPVGTYGSPSFTINVTYSGLTEELTEIEQQVTNNTFAIAALDEEVDSIVNGSDVWVEFTTGWENNKYYNGNDDPVPSSQSFDGTKCQKFSGLAGKTIRLYAGISTAAIPLYIITDSSNNQIEKFYSTTESFRDNPKVLTIPNNGYYVYVNLYNYADTDKVEEYVHVDSMDERIDKLKQEINNIDTRVDILEKQGLSGKTIVVFGDSISEFKDENHKGWIDYASEISGAIFINCAVGGTQLRQRRAEITLFDASKSYAVSDWVYYKPSGTMNCYKCINAHTGAWDANDFEEISYNYYVYSTLDIINLVKAACNTTIPAYADRFVNQEAAAECILAHYGDDNTSIINTLKNIDWTKVDGVIIMAGTNDFAELQPGTSGSTDINKTYGAINEMTRLLCSVYPKVALYYNSILIRWYDYSGGIGADDKWCDVYIPTGGTQTLKQFAEGCMDEFRNNHIPVLDMYNTLGWNKHNFSNFFRDNDGTHPYKGFKQIGGKISSFLVANKTF